MKQHIYHQDPLDNHRSQLMKLIIEHYISLRLNHITRMHSIQMTGKNVRLLTSITVRSAGIRN
ncbi:THAP-type domain-containing protein [Aphis craccivora]|uniref:THAP-type domain-containing protein n=1 Tax=Aphis craccivora TaxID=307492 RepID=A0A6G0VK32_APHCR|nr:THAP-type domain-containing protein [Aphis craccivora]